jgi:ketosteroid isomerase-like protein
MSANLDLVRSICANWERGDFYSSVEWFDPEIEFVYADGPAPGTWRGLDGMAAGTREWFKAWERVRIEPEKYIELDSELVLAFMHGRARGRTSGVDVSRMAQAGFLFHFRDGKVIKLVVYLDRDRALADLGLAPEDSSEPR